MFGSDILEYGIPGEISNNYISRSVIEMDPERQIFYFTKKLI